MLAKDVQVGQRFTVDNYESRGSVVRVETGFFIMAHHLNLCVIVGCIFVVGQDSILKTVHKDELVTLEENND